MLEQVLVRSAVSLAQSLHRTNNNHIRETCKPQSLHLRRNLRPMCRSFRAHGAVRPCVGAPPDGLGNWLSWFSLGISSSPALSAAVKAAPVCSGLPAHNLPPARTRSIEVLTANKSTWTCSTSAPTSLVGCLVQLGVVRSRQTARQELQVRAEPPHPPSPHSLIDPGGTGCPP